MSLPILVLFISLLCGRIQSPGVKEERLQEKTGPAFLDLLKMAEKKGVRPLSGEDQQTFLYTFVRGGQRRESMVLIPRAEFETEKLRRMDRQCVSLLASMPFNLGDGAILRVSILGDEHKSDIFQIHLDPAHNRLHRTWMPIRFAIPNDFYEFRIRLEVHEGPQGDSTGDWVGIAPGLDPGCLLAKFP